MEFKTRVEDTVKNFWKVFASRDGDVVKKCLQYIHKDFIGYGTEPHEVWLCRDDFKQQLLHEVDFVPQPVDIVPKSIKTITTGSVAVCIADMIYRFELKKKKMVVDPFRLVMTLQDTTQGIKFLSMASITFDNYTPDQVPWPGLLEPKKYSEVSVLFTDFIGFSDIVRNISAKKLVRELNEIFSAFDDIISNNQLIKVKTIGDAYMAVSGIQQDQKNHAANAVHAGLEMIQFLHTKNKRGQTKWSIRAGIHSGPVVAGVIGKQGLTFDAWGETVNLANRMEQHGVPGKINVSSLTHQLIKHQFTFESRGEIKLKGGYIENMYTIERTSP